MSGQSLHISRCVQSQAIVLFTGAPLPAPGAQVKAGVDEGHRGRARRRKAAGIKGSDRIVSSPSRLHVTLCRKHLLSAISLLTSMAGQCTSTMLARNHPKP